MTQVDPILHPIPKKFRDDPEVFPFFDFLVAVLRDLRERTGGSEDTVADTEAEVITTDGGNRSHRFWQDEIDKIWSHLFCNNPRDYRDQIMDLRSEIHTLKRQNNTLFQLLDELIERYDSGT
jgi:hypothetical protein